MNDLLRRQLRLLELSPDGLPPDLETWRAFLEHISRSYDDADKNGLVLEHSLLYVRASKMSDTRLYLQQAGLQSLIDSLPEGLCALEPEGRVVFANAAAHRYVGSREDSLVGQPILRQFRFRFADSATNPNTLLPMVARGETFVDETARLCMDGAELPMSCILTPLRKGDSVVGAVFIFRDLTETVKARETIRRAEDHYRNLFQGLPLAVYEEDFSAVGAWLRELRSGGVTVLRDYLARHPEDLRRAISMIRVLDVNPAAVALLEADTADELLGPLNPAVFTEETFVSMEDQLVAIWEDREHVDLELTGTTLKGNRLDAIFHWSTTRVGGQLDLTKVLVAVTDITERKQVEEQMAELVRSKDEFLASISHELRTPLTSVVGFTDVLMDRNADVLPHERTELMQLIAHEAQEAAWIIEDLLAFARADIRTLAIAPVNLDLGEQVQAVLSGLKQATAERVHFTSATARAWADPGRVRQIVRNLIINAIHYGGQEIRVRIVGGHQIACLAVVDDGEGIPLKERDAIFEPYHRAHRVTGQPGSMGLGLSVSRSLARLMGGDLSYRYGDDQSTFELTLPTAPGGGGSLRG